MRIRPILAACLWAATSVAAPDLYVATNGNDANPGSEAKPFATLVGARDAIRAMKKNGPLPAGVTVWVRGGVYEITETLTLGPEDSGTETAPIVYRAYPNEKPVLTGALKVPAFKPFKGDILQCDLTGTPLAKIPFRQLFLRGERQIMARYPNADPKDPHGGEWAHVLDVDVTGTKEHFTSTTGVKDHFTCTEDMRDRMKAWTQLQDAQICIHPSYGWGWNIVPIKAVDPPESVITLGKKTSYDLSIGDRYYVQNLLAELDAPGEWYLDREASILYFRPPSPIHEGDVRAPIAGTLIEMKGASHVTMRGFILEECDGDAVTIQDCETCVAAQSVIRNCGGWGVKIAGGHKSGAMGNDIYATGAGGVALDGGNRKTLERGDNFATNNYIHHIAAFQKVYHTGVNIRGVGNTASHNLIHDCYHQAILLGDNENIVEYNIIHHTNLGSEDTGGIYMSSRDWTKRGCVIRHNILHHCGGFGKMNSWQPVKDGKVEFQYPHFTWAIYLDCPTTGNLIYGNVIWSAPIWGVFNASGRDNTWENNIIVGSPAFQAYTMGDQWECWPDMFKKLREGQQPGSPYLKKYPMLAEYNEVRPGAMRNVRFLRNILYYTQEDGRWLREKKQKEWEGGQLLYSYATHMDDFPKNEFDYNIVYAPPGVDLKIRFQRAPGGWEWLTWEKWRALGSDAHSVFANPMFVDPARHDYRLKPESPALKAGFKPIPFEQIGPYADETRATWPIVEAPGVSALGDFTTVRYFKLPGYEPVPPREFAPRNGLGNFFAKVNAKRPVKVAVFAGGGHAQGGWRGGVARWLRERYPGVEVSDVDASICGCVRGSTFSVFRFAHDVLNKKPDVVFLDFAVDDAEVSVEATWAAAEGMIRQAWKADPNLDLVLAYSFKPGFEESYGQGISPSPVTACEKLADHYGIPSINMGCRVAAMAKEGRLIIKAPPEKVNKLAGKVVFSEDGTYITPAANDLYAQVIAEYLGKLADGSQAKPHRLPKAFCRNSLERATLAPITEKMLTGAWKKMSPGEVVPGDRGARDFGKHFDDVWFTNTPGAKLTFKFKGTMASIYHLLGPDTGQVKVTVDGADTGVKSQVDRWCHYQRLSALPLAPSLEDKEHTITVELLPNPPDRSVPIAEARKNNKYRAEDFQGVALRFGWIRIIGEMVE